MRANKNGVNKDQKDKVKKDGYNRGQHCVYCLTYHMIFVTHYRKPVINDEMSAAMKEFSNHMAEQCVAYNKSTRYRRQNSPVSEREFLKIGKGHVEAK